VVLSLNNVVWHVCIPVVVTNKEATKIRAMHNHASWIAGQCDYLRQLKAAPNSPHNLQPLSVGNLTPHPLCLRLLRNHTHGGWSMQFSGSSSRLFAHFTQRRASSIDFERSK
jgi:hypothetical protein